MSGNVTGEFHGSITKSINIKYLVYLPSEYKSTKQLYPLILFLHGAKDNIIPHHKLCENMVNALKEYGCDIKFKVYPEAYHDSWTQAYNNDELYEWFMKHGKF